MDQSPESPEFVFGESFARILTEATHSLVCVLDRGGRILLFNEACERTTGYGRDEVLGRDARDFVIPPEEREAFGEFLTYVWKTGLPSPQVGHWQTKDGRRRLIAWHTHDWSADPYSRGAYTYQAVGGAAAPDLLARPIRGTLFFAGEATESEESGTVPGALASGRRAARRITG